MVIYYILFSDKILHTRFAVSRQDKICVYPCWFMYVILSPAGY